MKNLYNQRGLTLMELVVTLAILGVLAAVGTPVLMGNIKAAKNSQAQNTLKSIYLTQKNFYIDNNSCYYVNSAAGDNASLINQYLFFSSSPASGPIEASSTGNEFKYYILLDSTIAANPSCPANTASGYIAYAVSNDASYSINQNNLKTGF